MARDRFCLLSARLLLVLWELSLGKAVSCWQRQVATGDGGRRQTRGSCYGGLVEEGFGFHRVKLLLRKSRPWQGASAASWGAA